MTYTATDRIKITDAQYRKIRNYRIYRGLPTGLVPADTATRHIRALTALGWSYNALEQTIGGAVTGTTLANLGAQTHGTIERKTRAAALSLPYTLAPSTAVDDTALIPTLGAERRVKALLALGWTHDEMRNRGNVTVHLARGSYTQMLARRWRDIDNMYAELCMTPGPSRHTANRAARVGYAPPLAYDNIDDPNETPVGWQYVAGSRLEQIRELDAQGVSISEACRRLHCSRDALEKWAERNDMVDIYKSLTARETGQNRWPDGAPWSRQRPPKNKDAA
jgi:hypothetical protein